MGRKYDQHNTYQKLSYWKEVVFINSSKLSTPRGFSMSVIRFLSGWLLFLKFNINRVIPKPCGMKFVSIFWLFTFISQLMVFMTYAFQNKELARKFKLSENIWLITEVLSVKKDATFLFPTFKCNNYSLLFFQTVTCLKIVGFHLIVRESALKMLVSRTSSLIAAGAKFISSDSRWWYNALLTAFFLTG